MHVREKVEGRGVLPLPYTYPSSPLQVLPRESYPFPILFSL